MVNDSVPYEVVRKVLGHSNEDESARFPLLNQRAFKDFLYGGFQCERNKIIHKRGNTEFFRNKEIKELFSTFDKMILQRGYKKVMKFKMSMLVRILFAAELHVNEALHLKIKDIDFEKDILFIKESKDNKQRFLPMHVSLTEMLKKYCIQMKILCITDQYIFALDESSVPISIERTQYSFRNVVKQNSINYQRCK